MGTPYTPIAGTRVQSVFHPSDFSEASEIAFAHALKVALIAKAQLNMLHVAEGKDHDDWHDFPGVRETLERWQLLPEGSDRRAIAQLGIDVCKVVATSKDPVKACLRFLDDRPADLIVLAVHQRDGRTRWLHKSVGEPLAHKAGQMTLFIPHGVDGFVSRQDGSVSLRHILIPITGKPRPQPSLEAANRFIRALNLSGGTVTLLHVGPEAETPPVRIPDDSTWTWNLLNKPGEAAPVILETAAAVPADVIVMTTDGADGFLDALRGTTSERVLRKAHCPVLTLPVGSAFG